MDKLPCCVYLAIDQSQKSARSDNSKFQQNLCERQVAARRTELRRAGSARA